MSNFTLTIDDFDPVVHYANYEVWQTPNPQEDPTAWNKTESKWNQATYHNTTAKGPDSEFSLSFVGNKISIYGESAAPDFEVKIDGEVSDAAKAESADTTGGADSRTLLFEQDVPYGNHTLSFVNNADYVLLDAIEIGMVLGAEGAEMKNTTVDDRDTSVLRFDGEWSQQEGDNFFSRTSTWTGANDASVSFNFSGSAVWVYGDQVNDHGEFAVFVNGTQAALNNGRSGCGGGYAKYCEKLHGLAFFAGSLPQGTHEVRIVNQSPAEGNRSFFDLDYIEYTTPSAYAPPELVGAAAPGANGTGATNGSGTGTGTSGSPSAPAASGSGSGSSSADAGGDSAAAALSPTATLALVLGAYVLRALF